MTEPLSLVWRPRDPRMPSTTAVCLTLPMCTVAWKPRQMLVEWWRTWVLAWRRERMSRKLTAGWIFYLYSIQVSVFVFSGQHELVYSDRMSCLCVLERILCQCVWGLPVFVFKDLSMFILFRTLCFSPRIMSECPRTLVLHMSPCVHDMWRCRCVSWLRGAESTYATQSIHRYSTFESIKCEIKAIHILIIISASIVSHGGITTKHRIWLKIQNRDKTKDLYKPFVFTLQINFTYYLQTLKLGST